MERREKRMKTKENKNKIVNKARTKIRPNIRTFGKIKSYKQNKN